MYVDDVLLVVGIGLLAAALLTVRSILGLLTQSSALRRYWFWLGGVIATFMVGYGALIVLWGEQSLVANELVALMLLLGGVFALAVTKLSLMTTTDIVRIAKLERDAIEDPLTGSYNRRYLESKLDEEVRRATRLKTPLSTVMIDLDHFKHVNDTYGHDVGDKVLRHVCAMIMASVRSSDTVIRYGGEEFVVIAPGCDDADAASLAEAMRAKIAGSALNLPNGDNLVVTASLGVSSLRAGSAEAMLRAADEALYAAKRDGRNQICVAAAA
ncbi:GGDEF domain-containing protein [Devosia sp. FKR38]|uniref:GGDEF domain-containing protein n=1 Tax=Devosia sp. FKR38 TaxID=2562312 RepID=UPI001485A954|nr:GGDEF domain-containing protein [Devosia sp. FKR38]